MPLHTSVALVSLGALLVAAPAKDADPTPSPAADPEVQAPDGQTDAPRPPPPVVANPQPAPLEDTEYEDPLALALAPVSGGLKADDVARDALRSAPSIGIYTAELQQAAARVDQTMINFLPVLQGSASYSRLSKVNSSLGGGALVGAQNAGPVAIGPCPGGAGQCVVDSAGVPIGAAPFAFTFPLNSYSLQAQISIPLSDYVLSLTPARRSSKATKEAARLAREAEIIKVEVDARLAYYNWLRTIASVVVARASVERSEARLKDAEAAFEAGLISRADVLRLDSLVASTEAGVVESEAMRSLASRHLAVLMNRDQTSFTVGEDVLSTSKPSAKFRELESAIQTAHSERRELLSLKANGTALQQGVKATRANYYPRIDGFADGVYANPNQRFFPLSEEWNASWSVGVRLSYSVNQTLRARADIAVLKGDVRKLAHQEEALRRAITMEVTQAYLDRQRALAAIELNTRALRSSAEAYRVAADLYQAGEATTTDIIDAEIARVSATLQDFNAKIDLRVAEMKLRYAVGELEPIESMTVDDRGRPG